MVTVYLSHFWQNVREIRMANVLKALARMHMTNVSLDILNDVLKDIILMKMMKVGNVFQILQDVQKVISWNQIILNVKERKMSVMHYSYTPSSDYKHISR